MFLFFAIEIWTNSKNKYKKYIFGILDFKKHWNEKDVSTNKLIWDFHNFETHLDNT